MKLQLLVGNLILGFSLFSIPCQADEALAARGVVTTLVVKAGPQVTYQAIRQIRNAEPTDCKVLSTNNHSSMIEESFDSLPLIGNAKCVYEERYVSSTRIDYQMKSSDKFKAFEGSWILTPQKNGEETLVELRSFIDTGLKVPFARQITNATTTSEQKQKLADVKKIAESAQNKLAHKSSNAN